MKVPPLRQPIKTLGAAKRVAIAAMRTSIEIVVV
jgi:hypothetical protein